MPRGITLNTPRRPMEIFTKGISAVLGGSGEASQPSGVDTVSENESRSRRKRNGLLDRTPVQSNPIVDSSKRPSRCRPSPSIAVQSKNPSSHIATILSVFPAKKFRLEVGTQAMDLLVDVLERDRYDSCDINSFLNGIETLFLLVRTWISLNWPWIRFAMSSASIRRRRRRRANWESSSRKYSLRSRKMSRSFSPLLRLET